MSLGLIAAGAGALAGLTGFVVVLGSGGMASNALATPTLNLDALPAQAQGYLPYLEQGGLDCNGVDAALLAAQVSVADPNWDPSLVTTRTYTYRSTTGGNHNKVRKVTVTVTYEGLLQQTPAWWASHGLSAQAPNPVPGSADPFDPQDAIGTLAAYDCSLASQLDAEALSSATGLPTDDLVAAAFNDGTGAVSAYIQSFHSLPPDPQTQAVVSQLSLYSLGGGAGATGGGGGGPTTTVPGNASNASLGAAIVAAAQSQLGVPYVWGGGSYSGPSGGGFDCSGLALYAVYQASHGAIQLPHYTGSQVGMGQQVIVGTGAQALASGLLQPGDLVFFDNIDPAQLGWDHVGIYVGNGDMVDAPRTGTVVQVDDLATSYWEGVQWDVQRFA